MVQYNAVIDALMTLLRKEKCPPSTGFVQAILMAFLNGTASNSHDSNSNSKSIESFLKIYTATESFVSDLAKLAVAAENIPVVTSLPSVLPASAAAATAFVPAAAAAAAVETAANYRKGVICVNCNEEGHTLYRCTTPCQLQCCLRQQNLKRHGHSSVQVHAAECCPARRNRNKFASFIRSQLVHRPAIPRTYLDAARTSAPSQKAAVNLKAAAVKQQLPTAQSDLFKTKVQPKHFAAATQELPTAKSLTSPNYPTSDPSKAEVRPEKDAAATQQLPNAQLPSLPSLPTLPNLQITKYYHGMFSLPDSYPKRSDLEVTLSESAFQPIYSARPTKLPPDIAQSCWSIDGAPFYAPHNYIPERKTIYDFDDLFGISDRDRVPCDSNIAQSGSFPDTEGKYSLSTPSYTRPTCPMEKFSPEAFVNQEVLLCARNIKSLPYRLAYCIAKLKTIRTRTWDHYVFLGGLCPTPLPAQFRLWTWFYEPWWLPTLRFGGIIDR